MKGVLLIILTCISLSVTGQTKVVFFLERWIISENELGRSLDFNVVYQEYLSINFTNTDFYNQQKWSQFFFLNAHELNQIKMYLEAYKGERSIAFLNTLKDFSREKAYLIRHKVMDGNSDNKTMSTKQYFTSYIGIPHLNDSGVFKNRNRIQITHPRFQFILQSEKDVSEQSVLDFMSGGYKFRKDKTIWYLGDYTAQFGLGGALYQGYQYTSLAQVNSVLTNGFKLHTGSEENRYFRGVALEYQMNKHHKLNLFLSANNVDSKHDENGVIRLFSDGIHVTNTDRLEKNSMRLIHAGASHYIHMDHFKINTLGYVVQFRPLEYHENSHQENQLSFSNTIAYHNSRIHVANELNVDQFKYWSNITNLRWYLGKSFYLKSYLGLENDKYINRFKKIPKSYSVPETFYGYRLESLGKNTQVHFSFHTAKKLENRYHKLYNYRISINHKLKQKSIIQYRASFRDKMILNGLQLEQTNVLRTRLSYLVQKRGLWSWRQSIFIKYGEPLESGIAYSMQYTFKMLTYDFRIGGVFFSQNKGAFYIYESDVLSSGYTRGIFNSGSLYYIMIKKRFRNLFIYGKLRVSQLPAQTEVACTFGLKYKFQ